MKKSAPRTFRAGDKIRRTDTKVKIGDCAPVFVRAIRAGDKIRRTDTKVKIGDCAPVFVR